MATMKGQHEEDYVYSRRLGMMDANVLLRDQAFNKHSLNDGKHVSPYDEGRIDVGFDNLEVRLVQGINEEDFRVVLSKAQRATIGIPLDEGEQPGDDWQEMLKGGLQTALETQTVVFEVIGVARATTHQVVRSRRAAFHQQSMRASFFGSHPNFRMPESVWRNERARLLFQDAIETAHLAYRVACEEDISYQDARYILPIGTETYIMCEYTVAEFLKLYDYRACSMFQWEICHTVRQMGALLAEAHPFLAPYIKISCEKTAKDPDDRLCTFQGWEDVEEGCDFPWAKHSRRTFQPETYRIRSARERSEEEQAKRKHPSRLTEMINDAGLTELIDDDLRQVQNAFAGPVTEAELRKIALAVEKEQDDD